MITTVGDIIKRANPGGNRSIPIRAVSMKAAVEAVADALNFDRKNAAPDSDKATVANSTDHLGGIDMNAANLNLQIKRDGRGVPLPLPQQDWEHIRIDGLVPIILEIKPALATPLLSELQVSGTQQQAKI